MRISYPWNNCGFGWRKMNKLPVAYGDIYMALTVTHGYPRVGISFCNNRNVTHSYDYVSLQSFDQAFSNTYQEYAWISSLSYVTGNIYQYQFPNRVSIAGGFRVKYVYATTLKYHHEDVYDNASPFWTPGGCTSVQASQQNSYTRNPCNGGNPLWRDSFVLYGLVNFVLFSFFCVQVGQCAYADNHTLYYTTM